MTPQRKQREPVEPAARLVLFAEHVAGQLGLEVETAERWMREGRVGHTFRIGKRRAMLAEVLQGTVRQWSEDADEHEVDE